MSEMDGQVLDDDAEAAALVRQGQLVNIAVFADSLRKKRKAAIEGRRTSGIEKIWQEDQNHYDGVDEHNADGALAKSREAEGGLIGEKKKQANRSTAFLKITRPYCDAAAARVADMLLPTDDRNWAIRPTPVPELAKKLNDHTPAMSADGQPLVRPVTNQKVAESQAPKGALSRMAGAIGGIFGGGHAPRAVEPVQTQPVTVADLAERTIALAKESAEIAQRQIDDWLVECRYHTEVRLCIDSTARTGTGILKGPVPYKRTARRAEKGQGGYKLKLDTQTKPGSVWVKNWNFYPDPNCGNDIQRGAYTWERDDITARKLRDLKGTKNGQGKPAYIEEMIDLVLEEGPGATIENSRRDPEKGPVGDDEQYEIWYFYGQVARKEMEAAGCCCIGEAEQYPCMVTMVNDRIIKISLSPLDSGEFPYDVMVWQARDDHWAGIGVSRQMRECQKGANAAVRNLMDNAGLSSGPQFVIDGTKIEPANNRWEIVPRKVWRKKTGVELTDVRHAFVVISIETRQVELMNILQFWLKEAEDVTGLPMLLQGQQGKAPDTVGGQTMMLNSASGVLRRIARIFDDRITERHIGRYYEWLMLHGPEEAKGDFTIDARGSSALVERDMQNQAMMQMMGASLNPAYGLDPEKTVQEVLKGMRLDPKRFEMSAERKAQIAQNAANQKDPRIVAAEITAGVRKMEIDSDERIAMLEAEVDRYRIDMDTDRDTAYVNAESQRNADAARAAMAKLEVELELAVTKKQTELDKIKAKLADTTMRLQVQERMARNRTTPQVARPSVEPDGRARNGEAFIA